MLRMNDRWFAVNGKRYAVRWLADFPTRFDIEIEGRLMLRAAIASGLDTIDGEETVENLEVGEPQETLQGVSLSASAASNLWQDRRFEWRFFPDRIEYWHEATGNGRLATCSFLGKAAPAVAHDTWVQVKNLYSPQQNFAARNIQASWEPARVHAMDIMKHAAPTAFFVDYPFFPPPFFVAFGTRDNTTWLSVGLGAEPGKSHFNGFIWSGDMTCGAGRFYVEYFGYARAEGKFVSPRIVFQPGYDPHAVMADYVAWLETEGLVPEQRYPNPDWHRRPIFCGWGEQVGIAKQKGMRPPELAAQKYYEEWIQRLEELEMPFSTVVIDDKWMKNHGRWDIDEEKWPDLPGFIERQHEVGRHVLLWAAVWHVEGIPDEWCVRDEGENLQADVTHPEYEAFVRERVNDLIANVGADGFKLDWISALPKKPDLPMREPCWGVERLHRYQTYVYQAAHEAKPDALIETQTPNPLFRDSSDMIRLNDLSYAQRGVTSAMRERARVARIAGWSLLDCDNASEAGLEEWRAYMRAQPSIGVPSLYCLSCMESTLEQIPDDDWPAIRQLWREYLRREFGA